MTEADDARITDAEIDEAAAGLANRDGLVADALKHLVPGYHHSYTNGQPDPPSARDYAEAQALATIAIAVALGDLTAAVRRLNKLVEPRDPPVTERRRHAQPPPDA